MTTACYERMGATVTEIDGGSHVVMISHPKEVAEAIMTAVRSLCHAAGLIGRKVWSVRPGGSRSLLGPGGASPLGLVFQACAPDGRGLIVPGLTAMR